MRYTAIPALFFLNLGLSFKTQAYDLSIQKYGLEKQKNYCWVLFEINFRRPYNSDNKGTFIPNGAKVCAYGETGQKLHKLNQIEFQNRFIFQSNKITTDLMSKTSSAISRHVKYIATTKKMSAECSINKSHNCLIYPYLADREKKQLIITYNMLQQDFVNISLSCPEQFGKIGCHKTTIKDPYLGNIEVPTLLTNEDLELLKRTYMKIESAKNKVAGDRT